MYKIDFKKMGEEFRRTAEQRKEDNRIFYSNNLKNLANEDSVTEIDVDSGSPECIDGYFGIDKTQYKFTKFNDVIFGRSKAASENEFEIISGTCFFYCDFLMCGFSNITFSNCTFVGCNFTECYTLGVMAIFTGCSFSSRFPGKKSIDDMPSVFKGCELTARFIDCDISQIVLEKTNFYFTNFDNVNLYNAIFVDCSFDTMKVSGCDLRNAKIVNPKFIEFYIEDTDRKTKVDKNTFIGLINYNKKEKREIRYTMEVYSTFSELFEANKVMDLNGEYFYLYKRTELIFLDRLSKIKSIMGLITCGYGERPSFSLLTSLGLVLICGTLYMLFGVSTNNEVLYFHPTLAKPLPPFSQLIGWYHFSLVTFSTVGYGNVTPVSGSIAVSAVEMVLGVIMVGIWVSTLVRKMVR